MRRQHLTQLFGTLVVAAALVGLPTVGFAAGISTSGHNFNGLGWNNTGEICAVCHTPHNADTAVADAPLWNHEVTTQTFTLYSSATLDATVGQPSGVSKLCLSCHDGTVALDSFGSTPTTTTFILPGDDHYVGIDLSNDHPISFDYDDALATTDGELFAPTTASSGLGGTIDADMLFSNRMECASCHDPHDAAGNAALLVLDNAASALCLTCHNK